MGAVERFNRWRAGRVATFSDQAAQRSTGAHLDAAEYELRCIMRDVASVRMTDTRVIHKPQKVNWAPFKLEAN